MDKIMFLIGLAAGNGLGNFILYLCLFKLNVKHSLILGIAAGLLASTLCYFLNVTP